MTRGSWHDRRNKCFNACVTATGDRFSSVFKGPWALILCSHSTGVRAGLDKSSRSSVTECLLHCSGSKLLSLCHRTHPTALWVCWWLLQPGAHPWVLGPLCPSAQSWSIGGLFPSRSQTMCCCPVRGRF